MRVESVIGVGGSGRVAGVAGRESGGKDVPGVLEMTGADSG